MKQIYLDRSGNFAGEDEALDERGLLKNGYRLSVPMMMRDSATQDYARTNFGRSREALMQDQLIAATKDTLMRAAYEAYDKEAREAWKMHKDAEPGSYPLSVGEGNECTVNGAPGTLVKSGDVLICKPNARRGDSRPNNADAIKQAAYDAYDEEARNAWRNPR